MSTASGGEPPSSAATAASRRRLYWFIARHYLSSSRGRKGFLSLITWIALGGVIVGVTALVVVIAVMTGMQEDLRAKILGSTPHIIVLEQGSALRMKDWRPVLDTVLATDGVVGAAPFVLSQVVVRPRAADYTQPANLYGISIEPGRVAPTDMEADIVAGVLSLEASSDSIYPLLLGSGLADRLQIFKGDTLILGSFENLKTDIFGSMVPTLRQFEVTGTFTTGMYDYDTQNVYTTLDAAQDLLGLSADDEVSGIGVRTTDPGRATEVGDAIQARLGFPYYVESWITTNRALFSALKLEKLAMGLILFLIVVVAAFNIVSTLVMVVADRTREIGILKAMGMTRRGILRVFVLQGMWIGLVGTAVGSTLGVILCWILDRYDVIRIPPDVYFVDRLPVSLEPFDLVTIVLASVLVALAATIYPALQAAALEPVDAIRHE